MIDDKALDEHVERAKDISDWSENGPAVYVIADLLGDITALRAKVQEWWDYCDELQQRNDELQVALGWAKTGARQVTREQLDRIIGMIEMKTTNYEAPACAEGILEVLNLKIVEEAPVHIDSEGSKALKNALLASGKRVDILEDAPKAEGRECDCREDYTETLGVHYWCVRRQESLSTRCTITEGERDE